MCNTKAKTLLRLQPYLTAGPGRRRTGQRIRPGQPETPWTKGKCDEKGRFTFTPDPSKPGNWDVQVRLAGHGGIVHIPLGGSGAREAQSGGTGFSTLQIVIMAASVAWGLIGTALFFSRRKS